MCSGVGCPPIHSWKGERTSEREVTVAGQLVVFIRKQHLMMPCILAFGIVSFFLTWPGGGAVDSLYFWE